MITLNSTALNGGSTVIPRCLLWHLRDTAGLTAPKFGCGMGLRGACTVHQDGVAISCLTPVSGVTGKEITTIEELSPRGDHPLQKAWAVSMFRNATIAGWGGSCRPPRCSRRIPSPPTKTSTTPCQVTSADAAHTSAPTRVLPNQALARSQFEGAAVFGTSLALYGEITATDGKVNQGDFNTYPVARMNEAPGETHVYIVEIDARRPQA